MGSAICGGDKKYAEKVLKRDGHCKKHKKFKEGCKECIDKWVGLHDLLFYCHSIHSATSMALM